MAAAACPRLPRALLEPGLAQGQPAHPAVLVEHGQECVTAPSRAGSDLPPQVQLTPGPSFRPQLRALGTLQVKLAMAGHDSAWFWGQRSRETGAISETMG